MKDLSKIQFPIFPLKKDINLTTIDNNLVTELEDGSIRVIDPKSISRPTLGQRRLAYKFIKDKFKPRIYANLTNPIYSLSDLIIGTYNTNLFIDNQGKVFKYTKSHYVPLKYYKLEKYLLTDYGIVLHLKDIHCRFLLNRVPKLDEYYVGLLHIGSGYLLYDLQSIKLKDTRRMI